MPFHSPFFVFVFLPLTAIGAALFARMWGSRAALSLLLVSSLAFYGAWGFGLLPVLLGSAGMNYGVGRLVRRLRSAGEQQRATVVAATGIAINVALLAGSKYADALVVGVNWVVVAAGLPPMPQPGLLLPLGLSFYTFQQIAYLADTLNGSDELHSFRDYLLFVSFFGTVTSGPITNQKEILPQLRQDSWVSPDFGSMAAGLALFSFGLFKKLVLADALAPYADATFDAAARGAAIGTADAWLGVCAYFFQLYFDFSGYCDMALGAAVLVGIRLPWNFNSPMKASSVSDYWRRWHITLTRFITMYVYMPMAVRLARQCARRGIRGPAPRFLISVALPVIATFVVAGVWHGNGWTFVLFGLVWGVALAIEYAWREARLPKLPQPVGWLLTMIVALVSMALFRATDLPAALTVLLGMFGFAAPGTSSLISVPVVLPLLIVLGGLLLVAPNAREIFHGFKVSSDIEEERTSVRLSWFTWRNDPLHAAYSAITFLAAVLSAGESTAFLYYKF